MKISAKELRTLPLPDLEERYKQIKTELLHVRQKQHTHTVKPHEIYNAHRNVAVVMSVLTEKKKEEAVAAAFAASGKVPRQFLPRLTKKKRMELSKEQLRKCRNGKSRAYKGGLRRVLFAYAP
ncbi:60S ribosomal protein L35 [Trachipleistophora hominis]|uniref:60S ribosomal protein L35 n=1 Tax=Trachipleistophora hominis TaxID=72359 RepID=L7JWV1_TRAHO|nr:60S ribosomal protein L35 [Trachipleistophora hominis]